MPHQRSRALASCTVAVLAFVACSTPPSLPPAAPSASGARTTPPSASGLPFVAGSWPATGSAPCGEPPYTGELRKITAVDARTVTFELCSPDVAFPSKIASPAFGINDSDYLRRAVGDGTIGRSANGTGPYAVEHWAAGQAIVMARNPAASGAAQAVSPGLVITWSPEPAQRLLEIRSGTVDGIDAVGRRDAEVITADPALRLVERPSVNMFGIAMSNTYKPFDDERVRQAIAMGIDRQHIVDDFFPPGSAVATHLVPCAIDGGCEGDGWYEFDAPQAMQLLAAAGYGEGFETTIHFDDAAHEYAPNQATIATELQRQLKANLNIDATLDIGPPTTYAASAAGGTLDGIHFFGAASPYPDVTSFLDSRFGPTAGKEFGTRYDDIANALRSGASTADAAARRAAYKTANDLIKRHVAAIPIANAGSAVAFRADIEGVHASPLATETFAAMKPKGRSQVVFMGVAEPRSLYCADESDAATLRVCAQVNESLYGYRGDSAHPEPALASSCTPNASLTTWTCVLRDGVRFGDGAPLDAGDVLLSYAAQWDAKHPLHKGRTGTFAVFASLFGGFLNAAAKPG
jgi:peptide/nickel transport system substrate-binding protein